MKNALQAFGLDIVQPFDVSAYNKLCTTQPDLTPLPDFNRSHALGLLIGNTRGIWAPFNHAYSNTPNLSDEPDPLDSYNEAAILSCVKQLPCAVETRLGHHKGPQFVSLLQLAEISQLATISPVQLAVHPEYGLWFGLRAALILDADFPGTTTNNSLPEGNSAENPCTNCDAPCKATLERLTAGENQSTHGATWQHWIQVRDACPVGSRHRYSDQQVNYHHSKDRTLLNPLKPVSNPEN